MKQHKKLIIILLGGGIVLILLLVVFISGHSSSKSYQPSVAQISPTAVVDQASPDQSANTFVRDAKLDKLLAPNSQPSIRPLTSKELSYSEGAAQSFAGRDTTQVGTLVMNSTHPNDRVVIDLPSESEADTSKVPNNTTPFKLSSIPAGYYVVTAADDQGEQSTYVIVVEPNKVTRLSF